MKVWKGNGDRSSPAWMHRAEDFAADAPSYRELAGYLVIGGYLTPVLFHQHLLTDGSDAAQPPGGIEAGGVLFQFEQATPFLPEAPLWTMSPEPNGGPLDDVWFQPALPVGIAESLDGRRTDNVYVEFSALDVLPAPVDLPDMMLRAVWVARASAEYVVTLYYWKKKVPPFRRTLRFRYSEAHEVFEWVDFRDSEKRTSSAFSSESLAELWRPGLKALFLTLTLLRDLSPGMKRSALNALGAGQAENSSVGPAMLPQRARPQAIPFTPYLIPKGLDGKMYLPERHLWFLV